jgi:prophage regulatory protein
MKTRNRKTGAQRVASAVANAEDTLMFLLAGIRTYSPDYMHGVPKEECIRDGEKALAELRKVSPVIENKPLVQLSEVTDIVGIGRSTVYEKMNSGEFPAPIKLGQRAVRWRTEEVIEWINTRERASYGASK